MATQPTPIYVIFPYLSTSEAFRIRGVLLRPSEYLTNDPTLTPQDLDNLSNLLSMFYKSDNSRLTGMLYIKYDAIDTSQHTSMLQRLRELRILLAYFYTTPNDRYDGKPIYSYEYVDVFVFVPDRVLNPQRSNSYDDSSSELRENIKQRMQEPIEIDGFRGSLNFHQMISASVGTKFYPRLPTLVFARQIDVSRDLLSLKTSDLPHHWAMMRLLNASDVTNEEVERRIFTALEWYNRSCLESITEETALIFLSIAFESLLALERNGQVTERFKETLLTLLGRIPKLDSWIEQFYDARSAIVHDGNADQLAFYPVDMKTYLDKIKKNKSNPHTYRMLILYGKIIFRICVHTILSASFLVNDQRLGSLMKHNSERVTDILQLLNGGNSPEECLDAVFDLVHELDEYWLESINQMQIKDILAMGKAIVRAFMQTSHHLSDELSQKLTAIVQSPLKPTDQQLEQLKGFEDVAFALQTFFEKDKRVIQLSPDDQRFLTLMACVNYIAHPSLRSQLY